MKTGVGCFGAVVVGIDVLTAGFRTGAVARGIADAFFGGPSTLDVVCGTLVTGNGVWTLDKGAGVLTTGIGEASLFSAPY